MVPYFVPEGQSIPLPVGTVMIHDAGVWGLYVNHSLYQSYLIKRAYQGGALGWKIIHIPGIASLSWAHDYIKTCSGCLEQFRR